MSNPRKTLDEWLATYDPNGTRVVLDVDASIKDRDGNSQFVVVRGGDHVAVLALMHLDDHLCVDVHPFVVGVEATAGVFGMSDGRRAQLPDTGTTSHRWPSMNLIAVLIGEQAEANKEDE